MRLRHRAHFLRLYSATFEQHQSWYAAYAVFTRRIWIFVNILPLLLIIFVRSDLADRLTGSVAEAARAAYVVPIMVATDDQALTGRIMKNVFFDT